MRLLPSRSWWSSRTISPRMTKHMTEHKTKRKQALPCSGGNERRSLPTMFAVFGAAHKKPQLERAVTDGTPNSLRESAKICVPFFSAGRTGWKHSDTCRQRHPLWRLLWIVLLVAAMSPFSALAQSGDGRPTPPAMPTAESPIRPPTSAASLPEQSGVEPTLVSDLAALQTSPLRIEPDDEPFNTGPAQWWLLAVALMVLGGALIIAIAPRGNKW